MINALIRQHMPTPGEFTPLSAQQIKDLQVYKHYIIYYEVCIVVLLLVLVL